MIKSKLIRVSHNRLFRSKIKHRNHGRRIGSSDICPDVSSSVPCPINFSYTHNTTIRGQYIDTFTPFYQPITQQNLFSNSDSETIFRDRFSPFRNAKTTRPRSTVYHVRRNAYRNSRPAERSDGNRLGYAEKETGIQRDRNPAVLRPDAGKHDRTNFKMLIIITIFAE